MSTPPGAYMWPSQPRGEPTTGPRPEPLPLTQAEERERAFWVEIRRGLKQVLRAIDVRYGLRPTD